MTPTSSILIASDQEATILSYQLGCRLLMSVLCTLNNLFCKPMKYKYRKRTVSVKTTLITKTQANHLPNVLTNLVGKKIIKNRN